MTSALSSAASAGERMGCILAAAGGLSRSDTESVHCWWIVGDDKRWLVGMARCRVSAIGIAPASIRLALGASLLALNDNWNRTGVVIKYMQRAATDPEGHAIRTIARGSSSTKVCATRVGVVGWVGSDVSASMSRLTRGPQTNG